MIEQQQKEKCLTLARRIRCLKDVKKMIDENSTYDSIMNFLHIRNKELKEKRKSIRDQKKCPDKIDTKQMFDKELIKKAKEIDTISDTTQMSDKKCPDKIDVVTNDIPSVTHSETPIVEQRKKLINEKLKAAFNRHIYSYEHDYYKELKDKAIEFGVRSQFDKILIEHEGPHHTLFYKWFDLISYNRDLTIIDMNDEKEVRITELYHLFRQFIIDSKKRMESLIVNIGLLKNYCKEDDEELLISVIKGCGYTIEYNPGIYKNVKWDMYNS